jgi:hypothetical protein
VIEPPHAPAGVPSEFGCARDLIPGALFRFADGDEWFSVYATFGCGCGAGPWECAGCQGQYEVLYGRAPHASFDKHGYLETEHDAICWEGFEEPPEVEFVLTPSKKEKADLLSALSDPNPTKE